MNGINYVIVSWIVCASLAFPPVPGDRGHCESKRTCSECIRTSDCAWCSKVKPDVRSSPSQLSGCYTSDRVSAVCHEAFVENVKSTVRIVTSRPTKTGQNGDDSIQIRPQKVSVNIRPGEEITIDVEFRKAEDYPVDLYYLMDLSSSMSKYKNNLSKLGNKLADTMKNLTSDFQLGFGSFVDKVTLPFTSTRPSHLIHPCPRCRSPYSYKNHMALSKETNRFSAEVGKAEMSGNIDTPEGVFDGLMQAMVCRRQLNWREKARHIIVVSTDAPFHLAGDGKLGGVYEPHDELCHLNEDGYYTHALELDYPSVSQINSQAIDNNMNVIFAVLNKVKHEYHLLSQEIRGASLGLLDAGENIADLIKAQYEKISTTIRLIENSQGPVNVRFSARCSALESWKSSNKCTGVKGGAVVHFRVHLSVSDCSEEFRTQDVTIKPEGMNETLTIHLNTLCECRCATLGHRGNENNSSQCSYNGDLVCGQCDCLLGRIGGRCECAGTHGSPINYADSTPCLTNLVTNEVCSGRGTCQCGVCQCHGRKDPGETITGKYCECDNFSCDRVDGAVCGGRGTCDCGKCVCDVGWSGPVCTCPLGDDNCRANVGDDLPCSGKGTCICGGCRCQNGTETDPHRYSGKFCQNCMTCTEQCDEYKDCVECVTHDSGPLSTGVNCSDCTTRLRLSVTTLGNLSDFSKDTDGVSCMVLTDNGCTFRYIYQFHDDEQIAVWSGSTMECPERVNLIGVIAGTAGGTVLVGLLSLVAWKIVIDIHDKREYEKFEREKQLAKWGRGENPLFKTATTTYANPTYGQPTCKKEENEAEAAEPACSS